MGRLKLRHGQPSKKLGTRADIRRTVKTMEVLVKDLNRLADWVNGVSVVQMATIEVGQKLADQAKVDDFQFKTYVDELVRQHVAAQNAVAPPTQPSPETAPLQTDVDTAPLSTT